MALPRLVVVVPMLMMSGDLLVFDDFMDMLGFGGNVAGNQANQVVNRAVQEKATWKGKRQDLIL